MRYITIPEPFPVLDPIECKPVSPPETIDFVKFVRAICTAAAQKASSDTLTLIDIRDEVAKHDVGSVWVIPDEWQKTLADECKRLVGFSAAGALSAGPHIRAIVDAPSKAP